MAISSRLPKLFITHNSKFNEEETKELLKINSHFSGKLHIIAINVNDVTGASDNLIKSLNIKKSTKSGRSISLYDTFANNLIEYPSEFKEIPHVDSNVDEDKLIKYIYQTINKYDDEQFKHDIGKKKEEEEEEEERRKRRRRRRKMSCEYKNKKQQQKYNLLYHTS